MEIIDNKIERRGRHKDPEIKLAPTHETKIFNDPDGVKRIWIYNRDISKLGPISCETIYPENYQALGEKSLTKADIKKQEILAKREAKNKIKQEKEDLRLSKKKIKSDKLSKKKIKLTQQRFINPQNGKEVGYTRAKMLGLI